MQCKGKDAARFLHNLCTNDVLKLPPNRSCEAFFTTAQAKIVAYAWILNLGLEAGQPTYWVDLDSNDAPPFLQHLDRHLISEQVELADLTEVLGADSFCRPGRRHDLGRETGWAVTQMMERASVPISSTDLNGHLWRRNRLGIAGIDVIYPRAEVAAWALACGQSPDFSDAGKKVFEVPSGVEAGSAPVWRRHYRKTACPKRSIARSKPSASPKGCYIGQETVANSTAVAMSTASSED